MGESLLNGLKVALMAKQRVHILYKGRVQGVGFRFVAERVALHLNVKGWVRNLPDGDVEVLAEGKGDQLKNLLEEIEQSEVGRYIQKSQIDWQAYQNEFSEFRVEFVY